MVERAAGPTTWNAADDQKLKASHLFTSESVTEGHPDKIADQISDTILDAAIAARGFARIVGRKALRFELSQDAHLGLADLPGR